MTAQPPVIEARPTSIPLIPSDKLKVVVLSIARAEISVSFRRNFHKIDEIKFVRISSQKTSKCFEERTFYSEKFQKNCWKILCCRHRCRSSHRTKSCISPRQPLPKSCWQLFFPQYDLFPQYLRWSHSWNHTNRPIITWHRLWRWCHYNESETLLAGKRDEILGAGELVGLPLAVGVFVKTSRIFFFVTCVLL